MLITIGWLNPRATSKYYNLLTIPKNLCIFLSIDTDLLKLHAKYATSFKRHRCIFFLVWGENIQLIFTLIVRLNCCWWFLFQVWFCKVFIYFHFFYFSWSKNDLKFSNRKYSFKMLVRSFSWRLKSFEDSSNLGIDWHSWDRSKTRKILISLNKTLNIRIKIRFENQKHLLFLKLFFLSR